MHVLPKLPYAHDALEPYIDKETMIIHHTKHHQAYIDNLNKALANEPDWKDRDLADLLSSLESLPASLRVAAQNNGGGHWNHSFFWKIMTPEAKVGPEQSLLVAINKTFGDLEKFKIAFSEAATKRFGSGWAWLVLSKNKNLEIYSTPNQDNPIMQGDKAILGIDVWEHAYYLKYQNRRGDYLNNFWSVVNWAFVEELYDKAVG